MHRRDALAALSALVPVAGCLDAGAAPGPDAEGPYREDCPAVADDADRTVCYRRDRGDRPPLLLSPGDDPLVADAGEGMVDAVSFVLRNGAARPFVFNPYGWTLHRRTADGWEHVAPDAVPEPLVRMAPGQTHRWSLSATPHPSPRDPEAATISADVSPGVHAFAVDGRLGDGPRVECVARFEVVRRGEG